MLISRNLAHKVHGRLQVILSLVELRQNERAVTEIHELADFINSHVESKEDEHARGEREQS